MFIDEITIEVYGGKGGNGMASFRREKYVEYGGPSGGNGGRGGSIIFIGDEGKSTLLDFRYKRHIKGQTGSHGLSKGMHGANAIDTYVKVPLGTIVYDEERQIKVGEVLHHQQELIVAEGGKGGRGNIAFATARNSAPNYAENGDTGVYRKIKLELKVLADVGVIGYPSVGKSTLISVISNAKPKIAEYPFTTLQPNLGMVYHKEESFVIADLPGLIEDAHLGHGLGTRFLKHIERCRLFLHMLDITRESPLTDFEKINKELRLYNEELMNRMQVVVVNKVDVTGNEEKLAEIKKALDIEVIEISALTKKGIEPLLDRILYHMQHIKPIEVPEETHAFYGLDEEDSAFEIEMTEEGFVLKGEKIETLYMRTDFTKDEAVKRFARQLRSLGVDDRLRKMGAKHGDRVRILKFEFEFIDG